MYGKKLKELREENKLLQYDIADYLNIDRGHYGHYETEYAVMPIKHLNTLANYFNVSFDYLFEFTNLKQYENSNNDIDINIMSKRLKEFRKENKLTQTKLANYLNTTFSTISGYELGKNLIATPFLFEICSKYNISADYLLGKVDNPKYLKK